MANDDKDDPLARRILHELRESAELPSLPQERVDAMYAKLSQRIRTHEALRRDVTTVRGSAQDWKPMLPGIERKILFDDGSYTTWLARMREGAVLPAHDHPGDEELMILQGRVSLGELELGAGDYQHVPRGTRHERCVALEASVALLRTPSEATPAR